MKIIGQILLWAGFLMAAIFSVSKRDIDLLPEAEKAAFQELDQAAWVTQYELEQWVDQDFAEMDSEDVVRFLKEHGPKLNSRSQRAKEFAELSSLPVGELSPEQLKLFKEKYFGDLAKMAADREREAQRKKDEIKPVEKSAEQLAVDGKKARKRTKKWLAQKRVTAVDKKWVTVPWLGYLASMVVGIAGVVLLRISSRKVESDTTTVESEYATLSSSLKKLVELLGELDQKSDEMSPGEMVSFIDDQCAVAFSDFADARNGLRRKFGLQAFADIMTPFSSAERMTNRAWSAAADGYLGEAKNCISLAKDYLATAQELMNEAENRTNDSAG